MSSYYPYYVEYDYPKPPRRLLSQTFAVDLTNDEMTRLVRRPAANWPKLLADREDVVSFVKQNRFTYTVTLEVQHYKAEELVVKTAGGFLFIEARHNEREDTKGFVARNFSRRYLMPDSVNPDLIVAKLYADHKLTVIASLHGPPKTSEERVIPIIKQEGRRLND